MSVVTHAFKNSNLRPLKFYLTKRHLSTKPCSELKVDFDDRSFLSLKSKEELRRSILVFSLCRVKPLVKVSKFLMDLSYLFLRETVTDFFMKKTFFGHFCAGETTKGYILYTCI